MYELRSSSEGTVIRVDVDEGQMVAEDDEIALLETESGRVVVLTDVPGVVPLPEGTEMVMPGDNTEMSVELIQPIAMEEGLRFAIREGGRTVGAGRVTKIIK